MTPDEEVKEHECVKCGMVRWRFPHPIYICGADDHEAMAIIDLKQALDHLYMDCPKAEDTNVKLDLLSDIPGMDY